LDLPSVSWELGGVLGKTRFWNGIDGILQKKPQLNEVAALVREESFKRYAFNNDRWFSGKL